MKRALLITVWAPWLLAGQPAFEVASVKPSPPGATERSLTHRPGARLVTSNATLKMMILLAYQVMPFQVVGGPDWLESAGFDIDAKAEDPNASPEQFRQMIQRMLAERFQLKVHMTTKEMPIAALVFAKNGPKLVEAADDSTEITMRVEGKGRLTGVKATMEMLATSLTRTLGRKVVDETGLKGAYTFKLEFVPDQGAAGGDDPDIFAALQEQMGLALKPGKGRWRSWWWTRRSGRREIEIVAHRTLPT
jgi:uncharacterized protein (TIGR03435 family)